MLDVRGGNVSKSNRPVQVGFHRAGVRAGAVSGVSNAPFSDVPRL